MSKRFTITMALCVVLFLGLNALRLSSGPPARAGVSGWRLSEFPFPARVENLQYTAVCSMVTMVKDQPWIWMVNVGFWVLLSCSVSRWVDRRGAAWWRRDVPTAALFARFGVTNTSPGPVIRHVGYRLQVPAATSGRWLKVSDGWFTSQANLRAGASELVLVPVPTNVPTWRLSLTVLRDEPIRMMIGSLVAEAHKIGLGRQPSVRSSGYYAVTSDAISPCKDCQTQCSECGGRMPRAISTALDRRHRSLWPGPSY